MKLYIKVAVSEVINAQALISLGRSEPLLYRLWIWEDG